MSAADYACDFWNNTGAHPYLQQRMNQMPYYREPPAFNGHPQEGPPDFFFSNYNYHGVKSEQHLTDVSSSSAQFRYDNYNAFSECHEGNFPKASCSVNNKSSHEDDSPTLRALLTKQKKQQDCNFYKPEEPGESSCDYNKLDMLLSPSSERSSETDRDSEPAKTPVEQPQTQFYPWMKSHHGKPVFVPLAYNPFNIMKLQAIAARGRQNAHARLTPDTRLLNWKRNFTSTNT